MAEIFKIDESTWRFEDGFVRFFLLEGSDKAMMIDSGFNTPNALELAKTLTDRPVMLLNTHGDGDLIDLGDRPLKIIHIPGHTGGSVAILDINRRALYSGDSVQEGQIFMFGSNREPERFESSLDKLIALQDEYDIIYASHADFSVPGDYASKVKEAWISVRSGEVPFEEVNMFGNNVKSYTTEYCGFFIQ